MRFHPRFVVSAALAVAALVASPVRAAVVVTGIHDLGALDAPDTVVYARSFLDHDIFTPGLQLPGVSVPLFATDLFYEDYVFSIPEASFSSIAANIDLGALFSIDNFQARLYRGTLFTTTTGPAGSNALQGWSAPIAASTGSGIVQVIQPIDLGPGSYVLEVRGNVVGFAGGGYIGALHLAPIPEPGPLALLLAGFGAIGFIARRRRQ